MYDKLKNLGIRNPQGWFRVWVIASILWIFFVGWIDATEWYSKKEKEEQTTWSHRDQFSEFSKRIPPPFEYTTERERQLERIREDIKSAGGIIVRYLVPPVAVPTSIVILIMLSRWVRKGFAER